MSTSELDQLRQENNQLRLALVEMRQQLMQAQKLTSVGALASSITHEFNNILMTVINYAKMGLRHKEPATRDKAFDRILSAGHRAAKITTGMLSYARGKTTQREAFRLSQLVEDVLILVEKDLQVHRIRLEKNFDENVWAEVNSGQIQQVLINLIINARQAMDGGGSLHIGVSLNRESNTSEITVRDTGSGIPADKLPRIFDQFFSTKTPDEQGQGGSGLGLALCKEIIDTHRGRIRVESTVGRGTTFTLRFPMIPAPTLVRPSVTQKAG
ncbi:MAG: sensor histidine kinase [Planctomycetota bacterium]|jgi:signal transduction histidine kinase|nr:MAG: sensor histidine kinase [Planctomycetota bacterium]